MYLQCASVVAHNGAAAGAVGPRITAIILYLYVGQFLSKKRTAQALAELFGTPVCEATVATMSKRAADGLTGFLGTVADRIAEAEVAGFDETGLRVAGKLHWVHCARTGKYTLITCHPKRGTKGIDDAGVLGRFSGVAVHDAWAPYDTYADVEHQLCCAHALRELAAVADTVPNADWCWATQTADVLLVGLADPLHAQPLAGRDCAGVVRQGDRVQFADVLGERPAGKRPGRLGGVPVAPFLGPQLEADLQVHQPRRKQPDRQATDDGGVGEALDRPAASRWLQVCLRLHPCL